jgi:hypothetical protein
MTPDEFRTIRLNITKTLDRLMTAYDEGYVPHADTVSRKAPHDDS